MSPVNFVSDLDMTGIVSSKSSLKLDLPSSNENITVFVNDFDGHHVDFVGVSWLALREDAFALPFRSRMKLYMC